MELFTVNLAWLLAAAKDEDWVKGIIFAIGGLIWLIYNVAGALKKQEKKRDQQAPPPPIRTQPEPVMRAPAQVTSRPAPKRVKKAARAARQAVPAAIDALRRAAEETPVVAESVPSVAAIAHRPALMAVRAGAVKRWLTPASLREQFILTEILQPPIALRRERLDSRV